MRISYWSSDVCSSVLRYGDCDGQGDDRVRLLCGFLHCDALGFSPVREALPPLLHVSTQGAGAEWLRATVHRKSVVSGRSVAVRVDLGGRWFLYRKNYVQHN